MGSEMCIRDSHSIVREIALLALKTAHPDRNDITFKELEKDVIVTATNLADSSFSYILHKLLQTCL